MLPERVAGQIVSDPQVWFPGLAAELRGSFEAENAALCGPGYSTGRWVARDPHIARASFGTISSKHGQVVVERVAEAQAGEFDGLDLAADVAPDEIAMIQAAFEELRSVESLRTTVLTLVRSLHVLESPRGFDVSFSSPGVPFSVSVSVPEPDERDAVLRLAESIVHEAMHLQLSLIEGVCGLVTAGDTTAYSPWKERDRPVQGVLHGIYVFVVIHQALGELAEQDVERREYCERRRSEILEELGQLDLVGGLTEVGADFHHHLIAAVEG